MQLEYMWLTPSGYCQLQGGRVKVAQAGTFTLDFLLLRGLSVAELDLLEGLRIALGTLRAALMKLSGNTDVQ